MTFVSGPEAAPKTKSADRPLDSPFDPRRPIPLAPPASRGAGQAQRLRRSRILATIRDLLVADGFDGVTVRRIAEASGVAVQTIYNLVGPRDQAIVEAICEYTRLVGYSSMPDPADPEAVQAIIDRWSQSIDAAPEFCRQVCLISLTPSRDIFYSFRDRQRKAMRGFLVMQKKAGVVRPGANTLDLAEQLILLASALCMEWADGRLTLDQLRARLAAGFGNLMASALEVYAASSPVRRA